MSDIAIHVEQLGKQYTIGRSRASYQTFRESLVDGIKAPFRQAARLVQGSGQSSSRSKETIWALREISFDVNQGEVVGIIGRNGAGKSTLLKVLSRITEPTEGKAKIFGRVGSLLEVGTGFHPELTGRENIYLNGAILGMKRIEIERKFDEIVQFAEIEKFLDTPVKRYSSGMYVRLAFAVAAHLETEILLIDEVLAVGDASFQKKCLGKMKDVSQAGRTILFVSHQMNAVQTLCKRSIWLNQGSLIEQGETNNVINKYLNSNVHQTKWDSKEDFSRIKNPYFDPLKLYIVDQQLNPIERDISADECFGLVVEGILKKPNIALTIGFAVYTEKGELLFWTLHTDLEEESWPILKPGHNKLVAWIPEHILNDGGYRVEFMMSLHFQEWFSQPEYNAPIMNFHIRGGLSKSPYWIMARPGMLAPIIRFELFQ
jgi:lipopolysaccharide transport system ATP-binding protein